MYSNNHYNKNHKEFARELRTLSVSRAEKIIWKAILSNRQVGVKFLRQRPIHYFIVDFFCPTLKLIIEIDGNSHYTKPEYDAWRQQELIQLGYTIIRFSEGEVLNQLENVYKKLVHVIYALQEQKS